MLRPPAALMFLRPGENERKRELGPLRSRPTSPKDPERPSRDRLERFHIDSREYMVIDGIMEGFMAPAADLQDASVSADILQGDLFP